LPLPKDVAPSMLPSSNGKSNSSNNIEVFAMTSI